MTTIKELEKRIEVLEGKLPKPKWIRIGDLEWLDKCSDRGMTWDEAVEWCKEQGGRLPERWEMIKAVNKNYNEIQKLIEDDPSNIFWSVTESSATSAYYVGLSNGTTNDSPQTTATGYVRAVRDAK